MRVDPPTKTTSRTWDLSNLEFLSTFSTDSRYFLKRFMLRSSNFANCGNQFHHPNYRFQRWLEVEKIKFFWPFRMPYEDEGQHVSWLSKILFEFLLEFLNEIIDHSIFKIFSSKVGVSTDAFDLETFVPFQDAILLKGTRQMCHLQDRKSKHSFLHFYFTTILSLINNILLSNSFHSSIKQTTYQQPNPPIHQSIQFIQFIQFNNQYFAFSTHFSTTYFFVIDQ